MRFSSSFVSFLNRDFILSFCKLKDIFFKQLEISIRKLSDYCATKDALIAFHEALVLELDQSYYEDNNNNNDNNCINSTLVKPASNNTKSV